VTGGTDVHDGYRRGGYRNTSVSRAKRSSTKVPAHRALDLENYYPGLLTALANKWSGTASRLYSKRFGIGIMEWRVLSAAAAEPGIRPHRVCQIVGVDKGAVAKALRTLAERELVVTELNESDARSKSIRLTEEGWRIHEQVLDIALRREASLLSVLSVSERRDLFDYTRRLLAQLPEITD
jgi:DNA-binding MarR family transcriptional regulator